MTFDLKGYISRILGMVDAALDRYLPPAAEMPSSLHDAMRYSVFAGGKRIRPVLLLSACRAAGGDVEMALPFACAIEMIHTYSLIHDDLPAMDDDDYRRGRPTNHKVYGEATAILAGDALLTEAFILMTDPSTTRLVPSERVVRIIHEIAKGAGSRGMVGGQVVDMESEGRPEIDLPTVQYIHTHKTGALIRASVAAGGIVAGASGELYGALVAYGESIGLAFQIADDILDIEGTTEELGKDAGSDVARGKATYPALMGIAAARERAEELVVRGIDALSPFGEEADPLRAIARYIVARKS
ncbi:MAG: polyprenyl synthetase family protein [Desulfuromonadia bacterium]